MLACPGIRHIGADPQPSLLSCTTRRSLPNGGDSLLHALPRSDGSLAWSVRSQRRLGIGEFFVATAVAEGADEGGGLVEGGAVAEESGPRQVDIGDVKRHGATFGDLLGFGQVFQGEVVLAADEVVERGGEQAVRKVIQLPCGAQAVDCGGDVRQVERRLRERVRQDRPDQPDAREGQVIEGDVEEPLILDRDLLSLLRPAFDLGKAL